ncbi:hypothetical protein [uncultured Campylobacter sp.]|uniref:hypothetical protein n=1 Tax=uncultured Campylobacter sp. TaxID=218934 RepID=UPI00261FE62D|nr:hypothetical protein [uncultured Campylobacter sp.]
MASACLALFVERGFGAGKMAVYSAPICRRTMKHSVPMCRRLLHDETFGTDAAY